MSQITADKTIALLRHLFALYGVPDRIVPDNGPQFVAEDFAVFKTSNGVKHLRCSPCHPASNGAVERFVRTFKQVMPPSQQDGLTSQHQSENFLLTYRSTPHATTNVAPCDLFLGRHIRTRLDLVKPNSWVPGEIKQHSSRVGCHAAADLRPAPLKPRAK